MIEVAFFALGLIVGGATALAGVWLGLRVRKAAESPVMTLTAPRRRPHLLPVDAESLRPAAQRHARKDPREVEEDFEVTA